MQATQQRELIRAMFERLYFRKVTYTLSKVTYDSDIALVSSKELLDIQVTVDCRFSQKRVRDMIITYSYSSVLL